MPLMIIILFIWWIENIHFRPGRSTTNRKQRWNIYLVHHKLHNPFSNLHSDEKKLPPSDRYGMHNTITFLSSFCTPNCYATFNVPYHNGKNTPYHFNTSKVRSFLILVFKASNYLPPSCNCITIQNISS